MNKSKNQKHKIFLWIALAFFALTLVVHLAGIVSSYHEIKADFPDDPSRVHIEFEWLKIAYILAVFPSLPVELSCIRSIYKLLKYEPHGAVRICYIISAGIAFAAFVFQCLVFSGVIDLVEESGDARLEHRMLLITEWPVFIISFILGSIKKRDDKRARNKYRQVY